MKIILFLSIFLISANCCYFDENCHPIYLIPKMKLYENYNHSYNSGIRSLAILSDPNSTAFKRCQAVKK